MSFRLVNICTMYPGFLDSFYQHNPFVQKLSYEEHNNKLLNDPSDFTGSYIKNLKKLGVEAYAIVANDKKLQKKWVEEHKFSKTPDILYEQVRSYMPEILWLDNMGLVDDRWIRKIRNDLKGLKLVAGYHCAPINANILKCLPEIDLVFTCTPGIRAFFNTKGKDAYLIYHAFDSDALRLVEDTPRNAIDLVFTGSLVTGDSFHDGRLKLINKILKSGINLNLYVNLESRQRIMLKQGLFIINKTFDSLGLSGLAKKIRLLDHGKNWISNYPEELISRVNPPVYGIDMLNLLKRSGIVLNSHGGVAGEYAGNMRMFEVTGVGSCLLTENKKNMGDLFEPGEIALYENDDDCVEKIKWLLHDESSRKKIANAGHEKTMVKHTVEARCRQVLEILNYKLKYKSNRI